MRRRVCHALGAGAFALAFGAGPLPAKAATTAEIDEIRVQGNTVLDAEEIERAVYPFLGPGKSAADMEKARAALANIYRARGYQAVSVQIPPQRVTDGVVVFTVREQPIAHLRVVGAHYVEPDVLRSQAPSLHKGRILNVNDLKRDIARLNRLPDRTVTPSVRPGRLPDTIDADLAVQDTLPLHATLELNNRRSIDTTQLRLNGSLSYDNFFQRGDAASVFFQLAPQNTADAEVVGGSYLFHIPGTILALLASFTNSNSNVSTVGGLDVLGKGQIATVQLQVPLGLTDGFTHSIDAAIAYKRLDENDVLSAAGIASSASQYPVTYYPVTLSYQADWVAQTSRTSFSAGATFGLRGFGGDQTDFNDKRYKADRNFAYLRVSLARTQDLPHGFQLYGAVTGQASADTLLSTEQYDIGGLDTVRGYLESEALGDQGVGAQLEARSPSITTVLAQGPLSRAIQSWRFHLFYDAANTSIHHALLQQADSYTLSAVGVGTRVTLFDHVSATLEDAILLSRGPISHAGANRVLFRISGSF